MLIAIVTEHAFPSSVSTEGPLESEQPSANKRLTVQGDNDLCEPDNGPASLAPHVQLACMPCKSQFLFK